jgi:hypothetical protein
VRSLFALLTLVAAPACFLKPGPPGGTSGDDVAGDDGGVDAPDPKAFGDWKIASQVQLGGPGGSSIDGYPSISTSGHELFFSSSRTSRSRLYVATRTDASLPFAAADVAEVDGTNEESEPTISPSGLDLYFVAQGSSQVRLHRDTIGGPWTQATYDLPATGPFDFGGADRFVAGSTRDPFNVGSEIVEFTKPAATWTQGTSFGAIGEADTAPTLRRDGLEVLYEHLFTGTYETQRATRSTTSMPFTIDQPPVVIGFPKLGDPELSADGTDLYFTADMKIYVTHRDPL